MDKENQVQNQEMLELDNQIEHDSMGSLDENVADDIPSANSSGRDSGSKKKIQLAALGLVGVTAILLGVGISVARYEENKELERVAEAEAAAQDQKKLATGQTIDVESDKANLLHELPPPLGAEAETETDMAIQGEDSSLPPVQATSDSYSAASVPVSTYEPVANSSKVSESPSYTPPAPVPPAPVPSLPTPTVSATDYSQPTLGFEGVAPPPTVVEPPPPPPLKGSQSSVLVDVSAIRRVSATATEQTESKVGGNLKPSQLNSTQAQRRGDSSLMLLRGASIPCVMETKIDSTYQGFAICRLARDVYSSNGKTVVMERGTRVFGEQNIELKQGQARVAILWTRADTPKGVSINLDSPATGQLGEMGVGAKVNNHFWKRFGNSIMLSLIQDAISAGTSRIEKKGGGDNNTTIENTSSAAANMAEQALNNSINIPPTATVHQGTVINIMVARDIDFGLVYKIRR